MIDYNTTLHPIYDPDDRYRYRLLAISHYSSPLTQYAHFLGHLWGHSLVRRGRYKEELGEMIDLDDKTEPTL